MRDGPLAQLVERHVYTVDVVGSSPAGPTVEQDRTDHPLVNATPPDRNAVRSVLVDLIEGRLSREAASDWANPWVIAGVPGIEDPVVWDALIEVCGADLLVDTNVYLHSVEDFRDWLANFDDRRGSPG